MLCKADLCSVHPAFIPLASSTPHSMVRMKQPISTSPEPSGQSQPEALREVVTSRLKGPTISRAEMERRIEAMIELKRRLTSPTST